MGLTVGNIHVYNAELINIPEVYRDKYCICKLSEDWVTILDNSFAEPGVAISYPREDGTYSSESVLVSFKNGDFAPLTRYYLLSTTRVFYGEKVIIIGGQYGSEYGYERNVTYVYDKEYGSINSIKLPENLDILDVFANDDLLCSTFINSYDTNIPYTLHRVTQEGKVLWTLEIENSVCNKVVAYIRHNNNIYINPRNGFLVKIDENGRVLGKTYIKDTSSALFINGKLILSGDETCDYLFLVLDEDLNIVKKIVDENYQSIITSLMIYDPYKNLIYIGTIKNQVIALNVNTLRYSVYNLEEHFYLDTIDRNGYIYATGKKVSELYILSSEFKILSKHKLKSQIYEIDTTGENIYVLTSDYTCELLGYKGKSPTHIYEISFKDTTS